MILVDEEGPKVSCIEYLPYERLITCFRYDVWAQSFKIKSKLPVIYDLTEKFPANEFYCLALRNFHASILEVRSDAGNHANVQMPDNHDLRVRLLTNNIEEDKMKEEIEKRESEWFRNITMFYVYDLVFRSAGDIYHNLMTRSTIGKQKDFLHNTYIEILKLIQYGNSCLEEHDRVFKDHPASTKFKYRPF